METLKIFDYLLKVRLIFLFLLAQSQEDKLSKQLHAQACEPQLHLKVQQDIFHSYAISLNDHRLLVV
tara:strand:+ start:867 stop:1067 length:201 start_codon:yes stop_codon:yes gene_type:complete